MLCNESSYTVKHILPCDFIGCVIQYDMNYEDNTDLLNDVC